MCQPMSTAGLHGWEFVLKNDVSFIWDGISDSSPDHVKLIDGHIGPDGYNFLETNTANGTVTFHTGITAITDKDHHILISGAPNVFIDGAQPMTVLWQSDWYHFNAIQFCWKIYKANEKITIPAGTPFMFMMNYPKNLLESTVFTVTDYTEEDYKRMEEYGNFREKFYQENEEWKWHQYYKHGIESPDIKHLDKPYRPAPSPVIEE